MEEGLVGHGPSWKSQRAKAQRPGSGHSLTWGIGGSEAQGTVGKAQASGPHGPSSNPALLLAG